jgi:glutathione S-transferase
MTIPKLELVSHHLCPYVQRAVITLTEKHVPHQRTYIDLANKPQWFRRISPFGRVPLLRVGNKVLFESAVICEYLDETTPGSLHPADPLAKARHRSWIEFGSGLLDNIAGFYNAKDPDSFEVKRLQIEGNFDWLERNVSDGPYFSGDHFSLVDAVYGPVFRYFDVFESIGDFQFFDQTPKVSAWRRALGRRLSVQNAVAEDYPNRLLDFLRRRHSYLSTLIPREVAA